jgi:hypothetical protein
MSVRVIWSPQSARDCRDRMYYRTAERICMDVGAFARDGGQNVEAVVRDGGGVEPNLYRLRVRGGFALLRFRDDAIEVERLYADRPPPRVRPLLDEPRLPPPSPVPPRSE